MIDRITLCLAGFVPVWSFGDTRDDGQWIDPETGALLTQEEVERLYRQRNPVNKDAT